MNNDFAPEVQKYSDFYKFKSGAPIIQEEFGFYCLEKWQEEKHISKDTDLDALFKYDKKAIASLGGLGGCEAAFFPTFTEEILEDRGEHEVIRDGAGRHLLVFKGRRNGFMPEYIDHPVKDEKSWEELCKWRMDPKNKKRFESLETKIEIVKKQADMGYHVTQHAVGGYMYLRSLIGPLELTYMFYDNPELIHDCMKSWFELADAVTAKHQEYVTIDEMAFDEDICYNHGLLISPNMVREFLFPYYQQLISNIKSRQKDKQRRIYVQIDTDGNVKEAIDLYKEIGMDYLSPIEVASGGDVVEIGRKYPDLLLRGGIDKRILAKDKDAIDKEIDRIMPIMKSRGGYIPTCDHGVPEEVSFENYMHYRNRMLEYAK